jgi:type I restriction enzyme S subunit
MKAFANRLDSVVDITMGQAPKGDSYNLVGEGLPLIAGAGDFGHARPAAKKFTSAPGKVCQGGDIILGIRATIGEKVVADRAYCLGRGVASLRPRGELNNRYLWHWLTHANPVLSAKAKGATFKQVAREDIGGLCIRLPSLPEQQRTAEILDKADALRTRRRAALAQLDTLTQSIFLDMFGDPIANPRGWPQEKLSTLGSLDRGVSKHRPRNAPELLGGPYPFVQTGDVANSDGYIRDFTATYSEAGLRQSRMWPAGTLCITIAANIARTGILAFDACFPDSVVAFRAEDPATVEFVRAWLSFLQASLEERAPESAQKNINLRILRGLEVPVPKRGAQREFARRVAAIEFLKSAYRGSLAELDALFTSLQHRAFRGEL